MNALLIVFLSVFHLPNVSTNMDLVKQDENAKLYAYFVFAEEDDILGDDVNDDDITLIKKHVACIFFCSHFTTNPLFFRKPIKQYFPIRKDHFPSFLKIAVLRV